MARCFNDYALAAVASTWQCADCLSVQPYEAKFYAAKFDEWHALTDKPLVKI